ncbi:MAG: RnfABCDGE type electron transport complex subunit D [Actinomycetota bacterium]|nr:RnfABCDGE type electron transport complex subunit D [Actinomycetota bacterium]
MANKTLATVSPHLHKKNENIQRAMRDVLIALTPAAIWAVIVFGMNVVYIIAVSLATAAVSEVVMRKIFRRKITLKDLSAMVTGLLFAFLLPPTTPLWIVTIGSFISVAVAKELFGGLGKNIFNPAIFGRLFLWILPIGFYTTKYVKPFFWKTTGFFTPVATSINNAVSGRVLYTSVTGGRTLDIVTAATPLSLLKSGKMLPDVIAGPTPVGSTWVTAAGRPTLGSMFLGTISGSIGEISALMLLIGAAYLLYRRTIDWRIPTGIIGTFFLLNLVTWNYPLDNLFMGGLMLGAFFMATDWVSSPVTRRGKWIYAVGIGATVFLIRYVWYRPEGVAIAIFIWNAVTLAIDRYIAVPKFGEVGVNLVNKLPYVPGPVPEPAKKEA